MFTLLHRLSAARTATVAAGVRFCEGCSDAVSTQAQRAEARFQRAHDKALTSGFRF
ncbi:hypothetical protein Lfu02_12380 [Longispora fulva]|uniref:Uncharacterized protein n=1 Tax=Longispora fulva TaxID=619741 RepID=A0A8J7GE80_9ACTN|nr:hypothetical protein [Longispora fulva]MBG6134902.1 hypothetical protein [Longispora fulva]GIG56866.1 hypothetical protein Lfu02_12380 [Longispora fulva]